MSNETEVRVVETDSGKEVRQSYYRGCRGYAIGFASGCFMGAVVAAAILVIGSSALPATLHRGSEMLFFAFSILGFVVLAVAYIAPVWFYELLEVNE
jgi:hypothetical protein